MGRGEKDPGSILVRIRISKGLTFYQHHLFFKMSDQSHQAYSINDILNDDILLNFFKCLNSKEMVDSKLVCSQWNQIINTNLSLWQILDLPDGSMDEWNSDFIDMFEEKNGGNFKEIHIGVKVEDEDIEELATKLENLKRLPTLSLQVTDQGWCLEHLSNIRFERPGLVDFRVLDRRADSSSASRIKISKSILNIQADSYPHTLRVMWLPHHSGGDFSSNLISLSMDIWTDQTDWMYLLKIVAGNLKHLRMFMKKRRMVRRLFDGTQFFKNGRLALNEGSLNENFLLKTPYDIRFPHLMVLEINVINPKSYPYYLDFDWNNVLILEGSHTVIKDLPNVRELWIDTLQDWENLAARCPQLEVLRINIPILSLESQTSLVDLLRKRKRNVRAGVRAQRGTRADEIEIEMVSLKTLVVAFDQLEDSKLKSMKKLVKEVVDLKKASKILEIK